MAAKPEAEGDVFDDMFADIAQTERIGLGDFIIAAVIGVVTWVMLTIWSNPMTYPALWEDVAVASGIRPAAHLVNGYFIAFSTLITRWFGTGAVQLAIRTLGRLALSGIAIIVYAALREMLAFVMRARPQRSKRRSLVMQAASIVGVFAFICSEPVWRAGQCLSETTIELALAVMSIEFFFVFLRKGSLKYAYLSALFLGLLTAESVIGLALLVAFLCMNNIVLKYLPVLESPFFKPAVLAVSKWYMTFIYIMAILVGVGVNCASFVANNGLEILGETAGALPLMYLNGYSATVTAAASPAGWVLWFAACIAPFVVAMIRFPAAADEETFLPYATGIVFIFCSLVAYSQSSAIPALWFWEYCPVHSELMLCLGMIFTATTLAAGVTILGVDSICRNHARLARQIFGQDENEDADADPALGSMLSTVIRRSAVILLPALIIVTLVPARIEERTRAMLALVKAGLHEIVREAKGAQYLFTDGNLDTGIELAAFRSGSRIDCLPLVGKGDARSVYLRTRGMEKDAEDEFSFKFDVGMGLRSWIRDRPEHLAKSAVMMGFDLWKRDGKALPPFGGMLSRPTGWESEQERTDSVTRSQELANRVLDIYATIPGKADKDVYEAFKNIQWRLSRMCTYRSEQADLKGDAETAIAEANLAKRLNDSNETYQQVLNAMSKQADIMMQRLTPREGLQLALVRADFTMGKMYAETILVADPENADANFAMGMFYVKERQLTRAEEYLRRCLIRRPNEPSIYNNLAMIELELGKLKVAEQNAQKALKLIPDSAAVQDTLRKIRAAMEQKAKGAAAGGAAAGEKEKKAGER